MFVRPMLCKAGPPPIGGGWAFEWKWDGHRLIATAHAGGVVTLTSRNGQDMTSTFPEVAAELGRLVGGALQGDHRIVLDGEVVAFGSDGRPDIGLIQQRVFRHARPAVTFMVFDVLEIAGRSLLDRTYEQRRALLTALDVNGTGVLTPPNFTGCDGAVLLEVARREGMEGIVAKRLGSRYVPGSRRDWVKTAVRCRREVVLGGWRTGKHRKLGALMMGAYNAAGELVYLGDVGSGFTESDLRVFREQLSGLETDVCPFGGRVEPANAHWVTPRLVGAVEYRTTTPSGFLRYPAWKGVRVDKVAAEVRVEDDS